MNLIEKYNALDGRTVSREELEKLHIAFFDKLPEVPQYESPWKKIGKVLEESPDKQQFEVTLSAKLSPLPKPKKKAVARKKSTPKAVSKPAPKPTSEPKPEDISEMLNGLAFLPEDPEPDETGLNGPVKPEEIYQSITETILDVITKSGELPWRKGWDSLGKYGFTATNFESKKPYRGINSIMLNLVYPIVRNESWNIPYFLTFKQIEKNKGKLKKGSTAYRVFYYNYVYVYENKEEKLKFRTTKEEDFKAWVEKNKSKIKALSGERSMSVNAFVWNCGIPILKYYNVFNADDIEGIDWKLPKPKENARPFDAIETAERVLDAWDTKPPIVEKGNDAYYTSHFDKITMPPRKQFKTEPEFYGTLFHEMVHSTGHASRLNRDLTGRFGTPKYAFEELIAELGASFLNGETGILFHTFNNSVAYLKGWKERLSDSMKKDNKFFFRASSKAQAAVDHILMRDAEGLPKYLRVAKQEQELTKKALKKEAPTAPKRDAKGQYALLGTAKKSTKKQRYKNPSKYTKHLKLAREIRQPGESWQNAQKRATAMLKGDKGQLGDIVDDGKQIVEKAAQVVNHVTERVQAANQVIETGKQVVEQVKELPKTAMPFKSMATIDQGVNKEKFNFRGSFGAFLGEVERKPKGSVVMTLDAPAGSGKTRFLFQGLEQVSSDNYSSLFASKEEHPESALFTEKRDQYISPENHGKIAVVCDELRKGDEFNHLKELAAHFDVILIDSMGKFPGADLDELRNAVNGKLIIVIYQRTKDGGMRGGAAAAFDADMVCKVRAGETFRENEAYWEKNRYHSEMDKVSYNIYDQQCYETITYSGPDGSNQTTRIAVEK